MNETTTAPQGEATGDAPAFGSGLALLTQAMSGSAESANAEPAAAAPAAAEASTPSETPETKTSATDAATAVNGRAATDDGTGSTEEGLDAPLTKAEVAKLLADAEAKIDAKWRRNTNQARDTELNQARAEARGLQQQIDQLLLAQQRLAQKARVEGVNYLDVQDAQQQAYQEVQSLYRQQDEQAQRQDEQRQQAIAAKRGELADRVKEAEKSRAKAVVELSREMVKNKADVDVDALLDSPAVLQDKRVKECYAIFVDPNESQAVSLRALGWMYERAGEIAKLDIKKQAIEAAKTALPNPKQFDRTQAHGSATNVAPSLPPPGSGMRLLEQAMR